MAAIDLVVNGRFATQAISGVQRFAHSMTAALCDIARERPDVLSVELAVPAAAALLAPPEFAVTIRRVGRLSGHAWEQLELPQVCRGRMLFSPCNTGPLAIRRQVVTMHDAQVYQTPASYSRVFRTWYQVLLPLLARRVRIVTTDSHYSLRALREVGVLPLHKGQVVHAAVDHIRSIPLDDGVLTRHDVASGRYLLAIGSLSPHKNIRTIARAMDQVSSPLPLIVAGGGNSQIFADAGLHGSERVRFIGRVSDAELRSLYAHAAALVFPSLFEGFGLPPLEAMVSGCPVIASTGGSIPEICGDAADYVEPTDAPAWAHAIDRLLADPVHAAALRQRGFARAREYTWRRSAEQLLDLLLAAEGGPPFKQRTA